MLFCLTVVTDKLVLVSLFENCKKPAEVTKSALIPGVISNGELREPWLSYCKVRVSQVKKEPQGQGTLYLWVVPIDREWSLLHSLGLFPKIALRYLKSSTWQLISVCFHQRSKKLLTNSMGLTYNIEEVAGDSDIPCLSFWNLNTPQIDLWSEYSLNLYLVSLLKLTCWP
jgi:hypothetical protein